MIFFILLGNFKNCYVTKKLDKKLFYQNNSNIRSCAIVQENIINSLQLVYIRKNLKFGI